VPIKPFTTPPTSLVSITDGSNTEEILYKYPPQYKEFSHIFYWIDHKKVIRIYDLYTTTKLNNAITEKLKSIKVTIKGKEYELNLELMYQIPLNDTKQIEVPILMITRVPLWYWSDDDGTIRAYDDKTNLEISRQKSLGNDTFSIYFGKWQYEIHIRNKIQKNIKTNTERYMWTEEDRANVFRWWKPDIPLELVNGNRVELVSVEPSSIEWERVNRFFHLTMPSKTRTGLLERATGKGPKFKDCHIIIKIDKIVNPTLRAHWEHELKMLLNGINDPGLEYVKLLFHGTSKTHPKIIYEADQGWKISYSRDDALWGRGLYFAQSANYAHNYSYKTHTKTRKVFLAEVIVGDAIHLEEDSTLRQPPLKNPTENIRYDSVIGLRHDTWIWTIYDDARAYPTYLIEYKTNM